MFIGREKELGQLRAELSVWNKRTAVLIYGKRRVGKSTLIREAAKDFNGIVSRSNSANRSQCGAYRHYYGQIWHTH